jgi:hypothetical protein
MLPSFIKFIRPRSSPRLEDEEAVEFEKQQEQVAAAEATPTVVTFASSDNESASLVSSISDLGVMTPSSASSSPAYNVVKQWDKKTKFSDYVRDGLSYLQRESEDVIMLFESPSTANRESSFYNCQVYKFHDYPPASDAYKTMIGPCRYSLMNGSTYPAYLEAGSPPAGLLKHWAETVPGYEEPKFVASIADNAAVYAYLPCESILNHVNDPHVHYHLAGKDALHLISDKTPKLFQCTKMNRPCIAKVTHSMASKGIFVIRNDDDEAEFEAFLQESGNPTFIISEFVEIERNLACHFFVHPSGEITWFGSNENYKDEHGNWSMDSYLIMNDQEKLKEMQLPFVKDVAKYYQSRGFWGFSGVDVLFDKNGKGYLVDLNPRVTGSLPSLMVLQQFKDLYGFDYGLFRRNGNITYHGSEQQLLDEVATYNEAHQGQIKIVLFGIYEESAVSTKINIGVYGHELEECRTVLNHFARAEDDC